MLEIAKRSILSPTELYSFSLSVGDASGAYYESATMIKGPFQHCLCDFAIHGLIDFEFCYEKGYFQILICVYTRWEVRQIITYYGKCRKIWRIKYSSHFGLSRMYNAFRCYSID